MTFRTPNYRLHKARQCAIVTVGGRDLYLGEHGSPDSWERYHRLVAEHLAEKSRTVTATPILPADTPLTVTELIAKYWVYAKSYYVKNGRPTTEVASIKLALRFVRQLYGTLPAAEFSPKKLARRCINELIARIRRMYAWGVEEELVGVEDHATLLRVPGLKKGSSAARETERIRPVPRTASKRISPSSRTPWRP